jgi:hypothetical protein
MAVRASNQRLVAAWNAANGAGSGPGFRLALNRFADWLPEEYGALMTAKRSSSRSEAVKVRSWGGGGGAEHEASQGAVLNCAVDRFSDVRGVCARRMLPCTSSCWQGRLQCQLQAVCMMH